MADIGRIIRVFRKKHGLTQQELGDEIGVTQSTIVRWEKGSDPKPDAFNRLRDFALNLGEIIPTPWDPKPSPMSGYALMLGNIRAESVVQLIPPRGPDDAYNDFQTVRVNITGSQPLCAYKTVAGMYPRLEPGDLVVAEAALIFSFAVNQLGIISTQDGRVFLGKLEERDGGKPFSYNILRFNAPPLTDVTVTKYQIVVGIIPAGVWEVIPS